MEKHINLIVASSPHIENPTSTRSIMRDVVIALMPALGFSVYIFGISSLVLTLSCAAFCVFFEWASRKMMGRPGTVGDLSAVVTGILLAFNLPVSMPLWMAAIGCFISIVVVKQIFGGLGQNFANPAIVGRIALSISFASEMSSWTVTGRMCDEITAAAADAVTGATPLALAASGAQTPGNLDMFLGFINGAAGEISAAALLLGGAYLLAKKVIGPAIPLSFLGTAAAMSLLLGRDPIFEICSGGMMLGAIFMATDYVTSPVTTPGRVIFGIGCGLITMTIRVWASFPEGVSYAILLMNILTPHIDNLTAPKPFFGSEGGAK